MGVSLQNDRSFCSIHATPLRGMATVLAMASYFPDSELGPHLIHPTVQRFGAQRAGSTIVEINGSHLLALSQADTVAEPILDAVAESAWKTFLFYTAIN